MLSNKTQISTTGTIENDDPVPSISFDSATAESSEGMPDIDISCILKCTIRSRYYYILYFSRWDSATIADNDYVNPADGTRTLMIPAKTMGEQFLLLPLKITTDEIDEDFSITLDNPANTSLVTLGTPKTATGTILSEDNPTLSIESKQ